MATIHPADNYYWVDAYRYRDAEVQYYNRIARGELNNVTKDSLICQVQKRKGSQEQTRNVKVDGRNNTLVDRVTKLELEKITLEKTVTSLLNRLQKLEVSVKNLVAKTSSSPSTKQSQLNGPKKQQAAPTSTSAKSKAPQKKDNGDDIDLFGSDSESEDEAKAKIREERLAAYHAKKAKKPSKEVAKSSVILDVKPWDDETDMKQLEASVRSIEHDGLLWGASKFVPLAYGIHKLQISCVIEDEKVSVDWLQETIESKGSDYVQSVDIAAFNKI